MLLLETSTLHDRKRLKRILLVVYVCLIAGASAYGLHCRKLRSDLCEAVRTVRADDVARLLQQGADPNGTCSLYGKSILHAEAGHLYSSNPGQIKVLRVLLRAGAKPQGQHTLDAVLNNCDSTRPGCRELVQELLDKGARLQPDSLEAAIVHGRPRYVRAVLDMGADARQRPPGGNYPLVVAARDSGGTPERQADAVENARLLVARGADVNAKQDGMTVLQTACYAGNLQLVQFLLQQGALLDKQGVQEAFDIALYSQYPDLIRFFAARGADVNRVNAKGESPLVWMQYTPGPVGKHTYLNLIPLLKSLGAKERRVPMPSTPLQHAGGHVPLPPQSAGTVRR